MAYVLGFFAADGYITVNRRGGQFWCIQITDKKLLEQIKVAIQAEHKISARLGQGDEKTLYRLQIGSIEMCDDLRRLGFTERKTKNLVIPNVPNKYFLHFVRGYFDGDGNIWLGRIHKDRKIAPFVLSLAFTSGAHQFLQDLKQKFGDLGIIGGSIYKSKANYSRLQFSTVNALKLSNFMYNQGVLRKEDLFLARKRRVFDKFRLLKKADVV